MDLDYQSKAVRKFIGKLNSIELVYCTISYNLLRPVWYFGGARLGLQELVPSNFVDSAKAHVLVSFA